jgi:hypothetical protein
MRWTRPRFTLGQMMIAVALSPIVLAAGFWAGFHWGTTVSVTTFPPGSLEPTVRSAADGRTTEFTLVLTETIQASSKAALLAMAVTSALLALLWISIARAIRRMRRA